MISQGVAAGNATTASEMWVDIDDDGRYATVSPGLLAELGDDVAAAVGQSWAGIVGDESSPAGSSSLVRCADGRSVHLELVQLERVGPISWRAWLRIRNGDEGRASLATVLSEWRAAARRVSELSPADPTRVLALVEELRFREAYQRAAEAAMMRREGM